MENLNTRPVVFLSRLYLGGIFLIAGSGKIFKTGVNHFNQYIHTTFEATPLPSFFLTLFGYSHPYLELILGILLLLGLFRRFSFTLTAFLCLILSQGQFIIQEYATAAHNGVYFLVSVLALALIASSPPFMAVDSFFEDRV